MLVYRAASPASPDAAWALLARPGRWSEWAPHIRGAWGLGAPDVKVGARGAVRILGLLPVPATITERGVRSWTWKVGGVEMEHRVEPRPSGCEIVITMEAAGPAERALAVSYGPLVGLLVRNLARVAAGAEGTP